MKRMWKCPAAVRFYLPALVICLIYLVLLLLFAGQQEGNGVYFLLTRYGLGGLIALQAVWALVFYWNHGWKRALFAVAAEPLLLFLVWLCIGFALPKTAVLTEDLSYVVEWVKTSAVFLLSYLSVALWPCVVCAAVAVGRRICGVLYRMRAV